MPCQTSGRIIRVVKMYQTEIEFDSPQQPAGPVRAANQFDWHGLANVSLLESRRQAKYPNHPWFSLHPYRYFPPSKPNETARVDAHPNRFVATRQFPAPSLPRFHPLVDDRPENRVRESFAALIRPVKLVVSNVRPANGGFFGKILTT